jgi:hypothetical protein
LAFEFDDGEELEQAILDLVQTVMMGVEKLRGGVEVNFILG